MHIGICKVSVFVSSFVEWFLLTQVSTLFEQAIIKNTGLGKVEFFLCNKRKIAVKLIIHQNLAVCKGLFEKL